MLLEKQVKETRVPVSLKVIQPVYDDVQLYQRYYESLFTESISANQVIESLLQYAFSKDKEFQKFKADSK